MTRLRAFAAAVDVITFEFENVSATGLDLLAIDQAPCAPPPRCSGSAKTASRRNLF